MLRTALAIGLAAALLASGCAPPKADVSGVPLFDQLETAVEAGNMPRAKTLADKILNGHGVDIDKYKRVRGAFARAGRFRESAEIMEGALGRYKGTSDEADVQRYLGADYRVLHEDAKARAAYEQALSLEPDGASVQNDYAYFLAERKTDLRRALKMAEYAYSKAKDSEQTQDTYGWVLLTMGNAKQALPLFEKAVRQDPENGEINFHLACALEAMHRNAEAAAAYARVLQGETPERKTKQIATARLKALDPKKYAEVTKLSGDKPASEGPRGPLPDGLK